VEILKSQREVELMRRAGGLVHRVLDAIEQAVRPGVTTGELNALAERMIAAAGATPLFKGVRSAHAKVPFPAALCTSVNEQVVHGIPCDRSLAEGEIVSVDCGVRLDGYCGDAARTYAVGRIAELPRRLLAATRGALEVAIAEVRPGRRWSEVAAAMQAHVEAAGFTVVREFVGHGIGREMHEDPKVPNYADRGTRRGDFTLRPGLVLAVEPMVNVGKARVKYGDAVGWVVVTQDGSLSAHFEHMLAVTPTGCRVLSNGR